MRAGKLLWLALAVASPASAQDGGAFGIRMGQPIASLVGAKKGEGISYSVKVVPKPHSEFESYLVFATPQTGVCKVTGLGRTHENDAYGTDVTQSFEALHNALGQRYGKSTDYDFLRSGSIWDEPRDYHMGVLKDERTRASYWTREDGATLPAPIGSIGLNVRAVSSGPYIALAYEFANFEQCQGMRDQVNNAGL